MDGCKREFHGRHGTFTASLGMNPSRTVFRCPEAAVRIFIRQRLIQGRGRAYPALCSQIHPPEGAPQIQIRIEWQSAEYKR